MPRARRSDLPDGIFHVTARGVDGAAVYRDDADRVTFLRLLGESAARHGWRCLAFCLLGTHYHLVLESTRAALSAGVQLLNGRHAQLFNHRHSRTGHLFGGRFHAWVVDDERHLAATLAYVRENPVRAGLCADARDWPWTRVAAGARDWPWTRVPGEHATATELSPLTRTRVRPRARATLTAWRRKSWSSTVHASTT